MRPNPGEIKPAEGRLQSHCHNWNRVQLLWAHPHHNGIRPVEVRSSFYLFNYLLAVRMKVNVTLLIISLYSTVCLPLFACLLQFSILSGLK